MEQMTLPFPHKGWKIGDKVKIVGKSIGGPIDDRRFHQWNLGDVGYVQTVYEDDPEYDFPIYFLSRTLNSSPRVGIFKAEDFEDV